MNDRMATTKMIRTLGLFVLMAILLTASWSCSGLRTELYREETLHLYQGACKRYKEGDYKAAGSGFESVIAMDPDYGPAHAALGNLALIREDYLDALAHYRHAISVDPQLEADLHPFIMVALAHKERAPLQEAGISLDKLYPLIIEDRQSELETILAEDIPLLLLAGDTMGVTPGRLGEMQRAIAEKVDPLTGSTRYRLFAGYLLFVGQTDDDLAAALIGSAAGQFTGRKRQEALVVLGQLHERQGEVNAAVDAYLAAVEAGLPIGDVAHHLARVYRIDIASILPAKGSPTLEAVPPVPMRIDIAVHLPSPQAIRGTLTTPKTVRMAKHAGAPDTF